MEVEMTTHSSTGLVETTPEPPPETAPQPEAPSRPQAGSGPEVAPQPPGAEGERSRSPFIGEAPASPAGPLDAQDVGLGTPPMVPLPKALQVLRISERQIEFVFRWRRELGEVFRV